MKALLELKTAILDPEYYAGMFDSDENYGDDKNIVFVSPQLSGRYFYKALLPFFCMDDKNEDGIKNTGIAITSLKKYDYEKQLLEFQIVLNDEMVEWADIIVFPFTTQPLAEEVYSRIRDLKPQVKIIYNIDFNFYELSETHPLKEIFSEESVINDVEDNMFFADRVFTTNRYMQQYIIKKFESLSKTKFKDHDVRTSISTLPTMINSDIMLKNVDWNPEEPSIVNASKSEDRPIEPVNTPEINDKLSKINEVFEKVVDENKKSNEIVSKQKEDNWKKKSAKKLVLIEENTKKDEQRNSKKTAGRPNSRKSDKTKSGIEKKRSSKSATKQKSRKTIAKTKRK